jgi:ATP-binding cassette subfamily B protein
VWQVFGNTPRAFRLVWDCGWPATLAMAGLTLLAAALPAAQAWVAKLIVDGVVSSIGQGLPPAQDWLTWPPTWGWSLASSSLAR